MDGQNGENGSESSEPERLPLDASLLRGAARRWERSLDSTLRSSVVPYGYTVTIWASGGYLIHLEGTPGIWQAFAFVSGAILAFGFLASLSNRLPTYDPGSVSTERRPDARHPLFAAGLHIAAVGLALGSAALAEITLGSFAWFAASFTATALYLIAASAELAVAIELQRREARARLVRSFTDRRRAVVRRVAGRRGA